MSSRCAYNWSTSGPIFRLAADDVDRRRNTKTRFENFEGDQLGKRVGHTHIQPQRAAPRPLLDHGQELATGRENLVRIAENNLAHLIGDEIPFTTPK